MLHRQRGDDRRTSGPGLGRADSPVPVRDRQCRIRAEHRILHAFLPELAPAERVGRLSGWAWGLGYAGGLLSLVLALAVLAREQPLFGISTEAGFNYRAVCLLAAGWFALFSLPLFMFAPRQPSESGSASPQYGGLRRVETHLRAAASLSGHRPAAGRPAVV